MNEVYAFIGGLLCAGFPLTIFWLSAREDRDYFERDRNSIASELRKLRAVTSACGSVVSEPKEAGDSGGWVKVWAYSMRGMQNAHALLAGRWDLIDQT